MILNQITIPSLDVQKGTEFYQKLGLHLIVDARPRYVRFELPNGDATFSIHSVQQTKNAEAAVIYFETENLDEEVKRLIEAGLNFDLLPTDQPWGWREARLDDPDGNKIVLYYAGEYRKNPPWRIKK